MLKARPGVPGPAGRGNAFPPGTKAAAAADSVRLSQVAADVHALRTTEGFVSGKADWKHRGVYMQQCDAGVPDTNEFWFVLNKRVLFPKCFTLVTANEQAWVLWCDTNHVSTNLQGVAEFMLSAPSAPSYDRGIPRLRL